MHVLSGSMSLNGKQYHVSDDTYDEPVMVVKFFDEGQLKLSNDERRQLGNTLFKKLMSIYKER